MKQIEVSEPVEKSIAKNREQIWYLYEGHKPGVLENAKERPLKQLVIQLSLTHGLEEIGMRNVRLECDQEEWAKVWASANGEPVKFVRGFYAAPYKDPKHKLDRVEFVALACALFATCRMESFISENFDFARNEFAYGAALLVVFAIAAAIIRIVISRIDRFLG